MPEVTSAHCNNCGGDRDHDVLHVEDRQRQRHEMLRCRGCHNITMRHSRWYGAKDNLKIVYYPPAVARREPPWMDDLLFASDAGLAVPALLIEIYVALHNNSRRLAGMGVRALIEHVMIEKVGDSGTFREHVAAFEKAGYISSRQGKTLADILDAGHATMHRAWEPSADDLDTLLDVTETIIETVYLHESKAKALRAKVPPRKEKS